MRTLPQAFNERYGTEPRITFKLNGVLYSDDDLVSISDIKEEWSSDSITFTEVSIVCSQNVSLPETKDPLEIYLNIDSNVYRIFKGEVNSPIVNDDVKKIIKLTALNYVESREVGFSAEESNLDFVSASLESVAWPYGFGNNIDEPAVRVQQDPSATLEEPLCIVDPTLQSKIDYIVDQYNRAGLYESFWSDTAKNARKLMPDVLDTLEKYINSINVEDSLTPIFESIRGEIEALEKLKIDNPKDQDVLDDLAYWTQELANHATIANNNIEFRDVLLVNIKKIEDAISLFKEASSNYVRMHNQRRQFMATINDLELEKCYQQRCVKDVLKIRDFEELKENEDFDAVINNVQFNVKRIDDELTINASNTPFYRDVELLDWQPDDEPCSSYDMFSGVNLIRLQDDTVNLDNKWLLVKRKGMNQRHIVKVVEQVNEKVYFELIRWDTQGSGGYPRRPSLDRGVGLVIAPFVPQSFPNASSSSSLASDYNLPESQELRDILDTLIQPPNREELVNLAKLVIAKKYAPIESDQIFSSGFLDDIVIPVPHPRQLYTIVGEDIESIVEVRGLVDGSWIGTQPEDEEDTFFPIVYEEIPDTITWRADVGSRVTEDLCEIYIVNIRPVTVKNVKAYYVNADGVRVLRALPETWYTIHETVDLNAITITAITVNRQLISPWEDQIYVSFEDDKDEFYDIVEDVISKHTTLTIRNSELNAAISAFTSKYKMNFVLYDRQDALSIVRQLCYQSRIGFAINDGEASFRYLSYKPDVDFVIGETMVIQDTFTVTQTSTESLKTVFESTWRPDGIGENKIYTTRHNTKKLGRLLSQQNYFGYRHRDLVEKSTTFHLIRNCFTYQIWSIETDLKTLGLELLDVVEYRGIKCRIIGKTFSHEKMTVSLILETPLRDREDVPYKFFWPSSLTSGTVWPEDTTSNENLGRQVQGTIPCP